MQEPDEARRIVTPSPKLDVMGIEELLAYIAERRAEIALAEAEIARKRAHRATADGIFRTS